MRLGRVDSSGLIRLHDAPADSGAWAACLPTFALGDQVKDLPASIPHGVTRIVCRVRSRESERIATPPWDAASWDRFNAFCDAANPLLLEHGLTLCVRPHAEDLLSDPHACRVFLERHAEGPFEVIADPAALITSSMSTDAPTHLTRIIEAHAQTVGVSALILTNTQFSDQSVVAAPLRDGDLDPNLLIGLAQTSWPPDRPVVLLEDDLAHYGPTLGLGVQPTLAD